MYLNCFFSSAINEASSPSRPSSQSLNVPLSDRSSQNRPGVVDCGHDLAATSDHVGLGHDAIDIGVGIRRHGLDIESVERGSEGARLLKTSVQLRPASKISSVKKLEVTVVVRRWHAPFFVVKGGHFRADGGPLAALFIFHDLSSRCRPFVVRNSVFAPVHRAENHQPEITCATGDGRQRGSALDGRSAVRQLRTNSRPTPV